MPTLSKQERLCSRRLREQLFKQGRHFTVYPLNVHWMFVHDPLVTTPAQVMLATSKRKLRHAVQRNRARRLMRECYRTRKEQLYEWLQQHQCQLLMSVNYIHTEVVDYHKLADKFNQLVEQLLRQLQKYPPAQIPDDTLTDNFQGESPLSGNDNPTEGSPLSVHNRAHH